VTLQRLLFHPTSTWDGDGCGGGERPPSRKSLESEEREATTKRLSVSSNTTKYTKH